MSTKDLKKKLTGLLAQSTPIDAADRTTTRQDATQSFVVKGDGNVVGNNNTVIHSQKFVDKREIARDPNVDYITEAQCCELSSLVAEWAKLREEIRKSPTSKAMLWASVNKTVGVASYRNMDQNGFIKAKKHVQKQMAILIKMPSAAKKVPDKVRANLTKAIFTQFKKLENWEVEMGAYLKSNFGKNSLKNLTLDELKAVREHVKKIK